MPREQAIAACWQAASTVLHEAEAPVGAIAQVLSRYPSHDPFPYDILYDRDAPSDWVTKHE